MMISHASMSRDWQGLVRAEADWQSASTWLTALSVLRLHQADCLRICICFLFDWLYHCISYPSEVISVRFLLVSYFYIFLLVSIKAKLPIWCSPCWSSLLRPCIIFWEKKRFFFHFQDDQVDHDPAIFIDPAAMISIANCPTRRSLLLQGWAGIPFCLINSWEIPTNL